MNQFQLSGLTSAQYRNIEYSTPFDFGDTGQHIAVFVSDYDYASDQEKSEDEDAVSEEQKIESNVENRYYFVQIDSAEVRSSVIE